MISNYLLILWRNTIRNRVFSTINILGLSVSMAASILLLLYVADELSYDQYHADGDRIYRLTESFLNGESYTTTAMTPYSLAEAVTNELTAVESFMRFDCNMDRMMVEVGDKKILEKGNIGFNDSTFFDFFSIKLLQGDAKNALSGPNKMVVSESMATKYFEDMPALGETVTLRNPFDGKAFDVEISGIMEDMPHNTHFYRDFLISMPTSDLMFSKADREKYWGWTSVYSYIKLAEGHQISEVSSELERIKQKYTDEEFQAFAKFGVQPMPKIHLNSQLKDEMQANGDINYVYIFIAIACFILGIASINYMNLATARAVKRAREVGMRKVMGAKRKQLVFQFMVESISFSIMAFIIAGFWVEVSLPFFNELADKNLELSLLNHMPYIVAFFCLALFIGVLAGIYPAFILSHYKPINVLKGSLAKSGKGSLFLRKVLVVFQFAISIALIIATIVIFSQWEYMRNKKLGLDTSQVITIPVSNQNIRENFKALKTEINQLAGVASVTAMDKDLTNRFNHYRTFNFEGITEAVTMPYVAVDGDFFKTFEIEMLTGRAFGDYAIDSARTVIINEAAAKLLGKTPEEALGARFNFDDDYQPEIIGVAKNFHYESLHNEITPMYFYHTKYNYGTIAVKVNPNQLGSTIASIKGLWQKYNTVTPFEYEFMEEEINRAYKREARFFQVFIIFSGLTIFIACLGIFGLATFSAEQRRKEIGIRKILGSSVAKITLLLSNDFTRLVLLANLFAWPVVWWFMENWLQAFAYRIEVSWWIFVSGASISLFIALFTVIFQALKAAMGNPVKALKNE